MDAPDTQAEPYRTPTPAPAETSPYWRCDAAGRLAQLRAQAEGANSDAQAHAYMEAFAAEGNRPIRRRAPELSIARAGDSPPPHAARTHRARAYPQSATADALDAAVQEHTAAQQQLSIARTHRDHPGKGHSRRRAEEEYRAAAWRAEQADSALEEALDDAASDDPTALARYYQAGSRAAGAARADDSHLDASDQGA